MSASGLFVLLVLLAVVAVIVLWPILQPNQAKPVTPTAFSTITQLQAQHEAILMALRDLDFDFQTNKLVEADYRTQRETLMRRGVDTLKMLDTARSDTIEAAVRAHRQDTQQPTSQG